MYDIEAKPEAFEIFNFLKFSLFIPPKAIIFTSTDLVKSLNLLRSKYFFCFFTKKIGLKNISLHPCFFLKNISLKLCDDPINRNFFFRRKHFVN